MSNIDKRALREAAKKAGPDEWCAFIDTKSKTYSVHTLGDNRCGDVVKWAGFDGQQRASAKAKFIAAANPATVLALLDELEAAEKRNGELVHNHRVHAARLIDERGQLKQRIAELEAREVNLPKRSVGEVMHMSGFSRDYAEGWCSGNDNAIHEIHAAGLKVAAAGKGE